MQILLKYVSDLFSYRHETNCPILQQKKKKTFESKSEPYITGSFEQKKLEPHKNAEIPNELQVGHWVPLNKM